MPFETSIRVARLAGSTDEWELIDPLIYQGKVDRFVVPKGFRTDFASIPRIFRSLIPKNGAHDAAAIIHDYLYREKPLVASSLGWGHHHEQISRLDADRIFLKIMKELDVNPVRRTIIYLAVRLVGSLYWA